MAQNIGNLAVQLSLDAILFTQGLDKSSKDGKKFADNLSKTFAGIGAATAVGGGVFAAGEGAFAWLRKGVDDVADVGRESQKLGVSTEKLSALQFAAGRDAEGWAVGLKHLGAELGAVAQGGDEARKKFQALGLDGEKLAAGGLDKAIDAIADRFKGVTDGAARARLAEQLFGREGLVLIPVLTQGAAGFAEADAAAKKFGLSVSAADAAKAIVAQRAMDDLGRSFEGVERAAAVQFAPLLTNISTYLTDIITKSGGGSELFKELADNARSFIITLLGGLENVAVVFADKAQQIAGILDALVPQKAKPTAASATWDFVKYSFNTSPLGWFFGGSGPLGDGGMSDVAPQTSWGEAVKKALEDTKKAVAGGGKDDAVQKFKDMLDKLGKPGAGVGADQTGLLSTRDTLALKLQDQISAYGLVGEAAERAKLARQGLTDAQLSGVDASIKELTALKSVDELVGTGLTIFSEAADKQAKLNDLFKAGAVSAAGYAAETAKLGRELDKAAQSKIANIVKESAGPFDKLKAQFEEINALQARGLDQETGFAALGKDYQGLLGSASQTHAPGAALLDTAESYSAIVDFQRQQNGGPGNVQERIALTLQEQTRLHQEQVRLGRQIAEQFERLKIGKINN